MRMLEVFVRKFQSIAKHHVPAIFNRWYGNLKLKFSQSLLKIIITCIVAFLKKFSTQLNFEGGM